MKGQMLNEQNIERFLDKVVFGPGGCWLWIGAKTGDGYGSFRTHSRQSGGKMRSAHILSYEYFKEVVPEGLTLDHLCRNRNCVNFDHLEIVTAGVNILRGEGTAAKNAKKTECPRGHKYDKITITRGQARRSCRKCGAINARLRRAA